MPIGRSVYLEKLRSVSIDKMKVVCHVWYLSAAFFARNMIGYPFIRSCDARKISRCSQGGVVVPLGSGCSARATGNKLGGGPQRKKRGSAVVGGDPEFS